MEGVTGSWRREILENHDPALAGHRVLRYAGEVTDCCVRSFVLKGIDENFKTGKLCDAAVR